MRKAIVNASETGMIAKELINQMYKVMDKHGADSCVVTTATDDYAEVDLFNGKECIKYVVSIVVDKEN